MAPPIRIAHLVGNLETGGTQMLVIELMRRLDRAKFDPVLIYFKEPNHFAEEITSKKWECTPVRVTRSYRSGDIRRLGRELVKRRIAIAHCHSDHANFAGRMAARVARIPTAIAHLHNTYEHRLDAAYLAMEEQVRPTTSAYVSCSAGVKEFADGRGLTTGRPNVLVRNGIDLRPYEAAGADRNGARAKFGIADDEFHILHTARLEPHKQPGHLLEAVVSRAMELGNFRLTYVGGGSLRDELGERLRVVGDTPTAGGVPLNERVKFAGWSKEIPTWLASADAFALVSRNEGLPLSLVEAMAAGTPVLAARVVGPLEVVRDDVDGILLDSTEPTVIGDALVRLRSDAAFAGRLAAAGRLRAKEFAIERFVKEVEALYEDLHAKASAPASHWLDGLKDRLFLWRMQRLAKKSSRRGKGAVH